jgi:pyruvate formate lyase activating enzyme
MHEAKHYELLAGKEVRCKLCPNYCLIGDGKLGSCRSRKNVSGVLFAINYGRTVTMNLDPIEKKPLYHYYPGSQILSLGANSCNLHCEFCQNYQISQEDCYTKGVLPDELLDLLLRKNLNQIAFTYTEPFTWFEYILDCGKLFEKYCIRIVLVTNGYINTEPLAELMPYIDAMNIDLKSTREEFYNNLCMGKLQPVLETIKSASCSCHVELTNLLIPNLNDSDDEISKLIEFVYNVNPNIPLHISRYFTNWKCHQQITPEASLLKAYESSRKKLKYTYIGNFPSGEYSNTYCPVCKRLLINRSNIYPGMTNLSGNICQHCSAFIYGRF